MESGFIQANRYDLQIIDGFNVANLLASNSILLCWIYKCSVKRIVIFETDNLYIIVNKSYFYIRKKPKWIIKWYDFEIIFFLYYLTDCFISV